MFARVKKSGKYQYLQIVENRKENGKMPRAVSGCADQLRGYISKIGDFTIAKKPLRYSLLSSSSIPQKPYLKFQQRNYTFPQLPSLM